MGLGLGLGSGLGLGLGLEVGLGLGLGLEAPMSSCDILTGAAFFSLGFLAMPLPLEATPPPCALAPADFLIWARARWGWLGLGLELWVVPADQEVATSTVAERSVGHRGKPAQRWWRRGRGRRGRRRRRCRG